LIGRALDGLELVYLIALFFDLLQERRKLEEAEVFPLTLLPAEQTEHFVVLNKEDRLLIGDCRIKENVSQPLERAKGPAVFQT